jgi:uncharacterized protein
MSPAPLGVLIRSAATAMALLAASPALSHSPSETERNREIVTQAFDAWVEGTYLFDDLLADDIVWTIHGSDPVAGTYRDRDDFVERASRPIVSRLATPIVPQVHAIWAEGDTVIVRFDGSATTTSGRPYRNQFVWIFWMENGKAIRAEAFLDLAAYRAVVENNEPREP